MRFFIWLFLAIPHVAFGMGDGGVVDESYDDINFQRLAQTEAVARSDDEYLAVFLGDKIYFDEGSARLDETSLLYLERVAGWLATEEDKILMIEAHAPDGGGRDFSFALAGRRAFVVAAVLESLGVASKRLVLANWGAIAPLVVTDQEMAQVNRRVLLRPFKQ